MYESYIFLYDSYILWPKTFYQKNVNIREFDSNLRKIGALKEFGIIRELDLNLKLFSLNIIQTSEVYIFREKKFFQA